MQISYFYKINQWIKQYSWVILVALAVFFVLVRFQGVHIPYHQDEYKWADIVISGSPGAGSITHPPLNELTFVMADRIFGNNNLRILPIIFFLANFFLLYWFVKWRFDKRTAWWSVILFSVAFYSVLASLMVDTDGQVLPFIFLLLAISYFRWREADRLSRQRVWATAFLVLTTVGLLIKFSFAIAVATFILEYLISERSRLSFSLFVRYGLWLLTVFVSIVVFILYITPHLLPNFTLLNAINYWESFVDFSHRNYLQTLIQCIKALFYLSPLLVLSPLFLIEKNHQPLPLSLRPLFIFVIIGLSFYIIAFDFSSGALDRYLQFLILPLSIISAVSVSRIIEAGNDKKERKYLFLGIAIALVTIFVVFVPQYVPSLHPKAEWISRVTSLRWNFLFPFTGGSGPLGFYVSFLYIAVIWMISVTLVVYGLIKQSSRKVLIFLLIPINIVYNGVFTGEYLFGYFNGYSPDLVKNSVEFIKDNQDILKVVVYNDNGGHEVQQVGKYERRMYATPEFEEFYREFLSGYSGHLLLIDIPRIPAGSFYSEYISSCKPVYEEYDKYIKAQVLDCRDKTI